MRPALFALQLPLAACAPGDSSDVEEIDLSIALEDPYTGEPVPDAWLAIDLGDELISGRTGADGRALLPGLPGDAILDLTVAKQDYAALTMTSIDLSETQQPWTLHLSLADSDGYESRTLTVSGTIRGAPAGAWVLLYGEGAYYDYLQGMGDEPVPFSFQAPLVGDDDHYQFSAVAIDDDYNLLGVALGEVWEDDAEGLSLDLNAEELTALRVETNLPSLGGVPAPAPPAEWCVQVMMTAPLDASGVVTGWNELCEDTGDGYRLTASHLGLEREQAATVYLADDYDDTRAFSWAQILVDGPGTVELLDTPLLDERATLEPGAVLSWSPPAGASSTMAFVKRGDQVSWLLYPGDDDHIAYPRLPEDFDTSLLPDSGAWTLYARDYTLDEDGALDATQPYRVAGVVGGEVAR
jgi:hypothetical protein